MRAARRGSRGGLMLLGAAVALAGACSRERGEAAAEDPGAAPERRVRQDERVALLFADCQGAAPYDVETGDVTAVLIQTLATGSHDALIRAKAELAADAGAFARVARLFARWVDDPHGLSRTLNAVDVATLTEAPGARDLLLRALGHPSSVVRTAALRGLARHGLAQDFDRVLSYTGDSGAEGEAAVAALPELDSERAQETFARWLVEGTDAARWEILSRVVAGGTAPELLAVCRAQHEDPLRWPSVAAGRKPYLLAPLARAGDERAAAELDRMLADPDPGLRRFAVDALAAAGDWARVARALRTDSDRGVRAFAASALLDGPGVEAAPDGFRRMLDDPDETLRGLALDALVKAGDETARDRALGMLAQDGRARHAALDALGPPMKSDPVLAARVFDVLYEEWQSFAARPLADGHELLAAIARVPDPRSSRLVVELSRDAVGEIEPGVDAHRWLVRQAANGGDAAHAVLVGALQEERDALRRLDLLEAIAGRGDDAARDSLLALVGDASSDPLEVLYAAGALCQLGPARRVLPLLKRVALRVGDDEVRGALWCLLWRWYPRPE